MTPPKTAADYAAVAVAPMLIFLMISSLANFLMLILYRGGHPQRVSWTLLMFTLGAVGIARVAIERDRVYALGYAGILGLVTFAAMGSFVDSPIFSIFILGVIGYLADVIVRDCTLIDDSIDASGQGLIDSGRMFLKAQIQPDSVDEEDGSNAADEPTTPIEPKRQKKAHQPGRTVMYLALAALPLFGLGQFFLRSDANTWSRAIMLLAFYLFASLSLLVTTSFLGLRRYLRQRGVEMPADVSIAWLGGGLAMIAVVLMISYIAPLPGKALASFELPSFLDSPGDTEASQSGWGDEGADKSNADASKTTSDPNADKKEVDGITPQQGAPEGDAGDGNREQGPTGKQDGGKQQPGGKSEQQSKQQGESKQQQSDGDQDGQQSKQQPSGKQQSAEQQSKQQSGEQQSAQQQSDSQQSDQQQSQQESKQESKQQPSGQEKSDQQSSDSGPETSEPLDGDSQAQEQQEQREQERKQQAADQSQQQQQQQQESSGGLPPEGSQSSPPSSSPSALETVAGAVPMVATLLKYIIFLVLVGIVGAFLWLNRHALLEWWNSLFGNREPSEEESFDDFVDAVTQVPPRAFASFRNPIGSESDLRRIVVITFQAFEAWTRENGTPRSKDETPAEFIRRVAQTVPQMSAPASQVVDAYNRIVYGRGQANQNDLNAAEKVWQVMLSR